MDSCSSGATTKAAVHAAMSTEANRPSTASALGTHPETIHSQQNAALPSPANTSATLYVSPCEASASLAVAASASGGSART